MKFFLVITFYLLQLSFGSENSGTTVDHGNSGITSSTLREGLRYPYSGVKPLLSKDSIFYIDSILKNVNSRAHYDSKQHLREMFENFTEIGKLMALSNFFFNLLKYLEMSLFEQFRKINHPNSSLTHFNNTKISPFLRENEVHCIVHCERAHAAILIINLALLKQRLNLDPTGFVMGAISAAATNIERNAPADRGIEFTKEILAVLMTADGKTELNIVEKVAFRSLLLFQKNLMKQSLDCMQEVFKPERKELVGNPFVIYSHYIDGLIKGYQLEDSQE